MEELVVCTLCGKALQEDESFCRQCEEGSFDSPADDPSDVDPRVRAEYRRRVERLQKTVIIGLVLLPVILEPLAVYRAVRILRDLRREDYPLDDLFDKTFRWGACAALLTVAYFWLIVSLVSARMELR